MLDCVMYNLHNSSKKVITKNKGFCEKGVFADKKMIDLKF